MTQTTFSTNSMFSFLTNLVSLVALSIILMLYCDVVLCLNYSINNSALNISRLISLARNFERFFELLQSLLFVFSVYANILKNVFCLQNLLIALNITLENYKQ